MKCYLSGKITGLSEKEFTSIFQEAEKEIKNLGYEIVNPLTLPHNHSHTWFDYMREDIKALLDCDCVYAINNWKQSTGATIEINLALSLGIKVIYQDNKQNPPQDI